MSGMSCVALMTTQMWPIWPSRDPRFDMPVLYNGRLLYLPPYSKPCKVRCFGGTYCLHFQGDWIGPSKWWVINARFNPPPPTTFTFSTYVVKPLLNYGSSLWFVLEQRGCWTAHRWQISTAICLWINTVWHNLFYYIKDKIYWLHCFGLY
jgi:hypothetical protein